MKQRFPRTVKTSRSSPKQRCWKGKFGTAQLQDLNLKQACKSIKAVDDQLLEWVSELTCPHFAVKNTLLYRVCLTRGYVLWQLKPRQPISP